MIIQSEINAFVVLCVSACAHVTNYRKLMKCARAYPGVAGRDSCSRCPLKIPYLLLCIIASSSDWFRKTLVFFHLFIYLIVHPLFFNKFHYMFIVHFLIVYKSHKHRMNPDCCWANWITKINNKAKRNRSLSHCQSWMFELSESNCFFFAWNLFFHIFD